MPIAERQGQQRTTDHISTELVIAEIWRDVLGLERVDSNTDFFAAGGDSLRGTIVLSRLAEAIGVRLELRSIFDFPSVAGLAERVRAALPTSQAISKIAGSTQNDGPLSFSQERMWFMHALASASAAYHVPLALRLRGKLDVHALQAALHQVIQRHEVLRMNFVPANSGVAVRTNHAPPVQLRHVSLRQPNDAVDIARVREYLAESTNVPFDLEKGALLRAMLVDIAHDDAVFLLVAHHIVIDHWSWDVLQRELADFYRQAVTGKRSFPKALPLKYSAYARWHRRWFNSQARFHLDYWRTKLANLTPVPLSTDFPRPAQQSFRGAKLRLDFDVSRIEALNTLAASHRSSLAMVLLTALKVLLHRYTQSTDIAVGVPVANRQHALSESLIGTLVNTLVFRTDLTGDPSFEEALRRVRHTVLEGMEHQDAPFEAIVQELKISRDLSHSPLFSVLFNMLNTPLGELHYEGLQWSRLDYDKKAAQFDLTVTIDATHDRSISFEYSTDLFRVETIERLAAHFMSLLHAICDQADQSIASLPLATAEEERLIAGWSNGRALPTSGMSVAHLLQRTCSLTPDAIALTVEHEAFTYRDLQTASDRFARSLRARGIGRGTRVGLCLQRSPQLIVAQWAAIKCGAAYVPLDPAYPEERLSYMIADARLTCVISDATLFARLREHSEYCSFVDMDEEIESLSDEDTSAISWDLPTTNDTAYIIYTSGSTGQPKGVVVSHGAVVNFLESMAHEPGLSSSDRVLAVTTLSFDIAVTELLLPWSVGAHVVLAREDQIADGAALRTLLDTHRITFFQATPSTWRMLIDAGWNGSPQLKALIGGEPLPRKLGTDLLERSRELWNMYGPTETTVWSTYWKVKSPQYGISLGRPIANTSIAIVDERMRICPIGVPGEIYIGGMGLADGYFGRPSLTAERFAAVPGFSSGGKMYKTGDRGRWRTDGTLEYLGRLDSQVKIRGHRVELTEIEAHLSLHASVKQSHVSFRKLNGGDLHLLAHIVPNGSTDIAALHAHLRARLPEYMQPRWIIAVDSVPLLPNGKIDTDRLPLPERHVAPDRISRPYSRSEETLCRIWRELLDINDVNIHDNFFALGGHSLLTVRMVATIRAELRLACTLPMVFRYPTVAALASALENVNPLNDSSLIALQPLGSKPPLFCICGIHIYQELATDLGNDIPVYGAFVPSELHHVGTADAASAPSVERLAAEYLQAIRVRQPQGPYRLLGFSFGGVLAYEMAQQLMSTGEQVTLLAILDSEAPDRRRVSRQHGFHDRLRKLKRGLTTRMRSQLSRFGSAPHTDQYLASLREENFLQAIRGYVAAPYEGTAVFMRATEEPQHDPSYGWDKLIARLQTYQIATDHLGMLTAPSVKRVTQQLRLHLNLL